MNINILIFLVVVFIIYVLSTLELRQGLFIIIGLILAILYADMKSQSIPIERFEDQPNISFAGDIDTTKQQFYRPLRSIPGEIDNEDVINNALHRYGQTYYTNNNAPSSANPSDDFHVHSNMYDQSHGYNMDEQLSRFNAHRQTLNKRAIDGTVRTTKNRFAKYFAGELAESENREWWNNESRDYATYGYN